MFKRKRSRISMLLTAAATTALLAGCGSSSSSSSSTSSSVSPATYVKSICNAVGPFEKDVQKRSGALNLASITSAGQGKTALQGFLNSVVSDTDAAIAKLKAAGTPDINNGEKISGALVGAFTKLRTALHAAATKAGTLPTNSPTAFKTAAQGLGSSVQSSMTSIGSSLQGLSSSDLEKAAAKEPACKALASS